MKTAIRKLLGEIYLGDNRPLVITVGQVVLPHAHAIADAFYTELLANPESGPFINGMLIDDRLHDAMTAWVISLFTPHDEQEFEEHVQQQIEVGHVHARINIPMRLLQSGIRILKREIYHRLILSDMERSELPEAVILVNDLLDHAASLIGDAYISDLVNNERNAQSMRLHLVSHNLAIECERLRSELFDWLRKALTALYQGEAAALEEHRTIYHSDFGRWVNHKAELLFPDNADVAKLSAQVDVLDMALLRCREERARGTGEAFTNAVSELNECVTQAAWLLSSLIEHTLEQETVRDPLTRLLNRRYLPSIMQREVKISIKHGLPFAILMLDVDAFKQLNDEHGHSTGDTILSQFGELVLANLRASDFVFRYGGEEFLVLLSDCSEEIAMSVAEKLRERVAVHRFLTNNGTAVQLTASIGVALHEGHPDYAHVIARADAALYEAKHRGRNCCIFAPAQ